MAVIFFVFVGSQPKIDQLHLGKCRRNHLKRNPLKIPWFTEVSSKIPVNFLGERWPACFPWHVWLTSPATFQVTRLPHFPIFPPHILAWTWKWPNSSNKTQLFVQTTHVAKQKLDPCVFWCVLSLSRFGLPSRRRFGNPKITPLGRSDRSGRRRATWPWDLEVCRIWRDVDVIFVYEFSFSELFFQFQ